MLRRLFGGLAAAALLLSVAASSVAAGGPPSLAFYVDGVRFRTVGTPTDFSHTGAPASSFDRIYALGGDLANVAEAKPATATSTGGGGWSCGDLAHDTVQLTSASRWRPGRTRLLTIAGSRSAVRVPGDPGGGR